MSEEFNFDDGFDEGIYLGTDMCEDCAINTATVHLTHVERNETQTFHLCEECARKRGVPIPDGETLLKGLEAIVGNAAAALADTQVKVALKQAKEEREAEPDVRCQNCGMKLSEFRSQGRLGCAKCYDSFEEPIEKILMQVHGAGGHRGKKYGKAPTRVNKRNIEHLRRELSEAIRCERFEQAAVIRDAIRGIGQGAK